MLGLALGLLIYADSGLYNVISYRLGHPASHPGRRRRPACSRQPAVSGGIRPGGADLLRALGARGGLPGGELANTPIAVAASTLAVAALFNPARRRVRRVVDRRFNRVRYDADRMVEAFAVRLKDTTDLGRVRSDLAGVVSQALEPSHVGVDDAGPLTRAAWGGPQRWRESGLSSL
jgi:hypothetical protein